MAIDQKTVQLEGFAGVNNVLRPERTDPTYLKKGVNIDIDRSGGISKRKGYERLESGAFHSVWSDGLRCFAVHNNNLVEIRSDLSVNTLQSGVYSPLSFDEVEGTYYFCGEDITGTIKGNSVLPWGIDEPNPKPTLSADTGTMYAGRYQVALTFVRSDGLESGSSLAEYIDLPNHSGIAVTNIPTSADPNVTHARVYVSTHNGETLYLTREIANGTSSTYIGSVSSSVLPLSSFNMKPAPVGQITRITKRKAFVARGDTLYFSQPYSYHWFNYHSDYFQFNSRITNVMPAEGGIWLIADGLYWISGDETEKMSLDLREPVKGVEGTEVRIPGSYLIMENTPIGYKWLVTTDKGIFVCFNQGVVINLTERNFVFPEAQKGMGVFVQEDGINRYLSVLEKKKDSDNTAVGDQATGVIIRNGVALEE